MKKYTVLTFNFNGYDSIRNPVNVDPEADYLFVTDKVTEYDTIVGNNWSFIIDSRLKDLNPLYASYYVRHHPFEYASTDIVVVVDASIQINDSLGDIVDTMIESKSDYACILTTHLSDRKKIKKWSKYIPQRIDSEDVDKLRRLLVKFNRVDELGSIGQGFIIYKNTPIVHKFNKHVWRYLLALGHDGIPNRLDEVVVHTLMKTYLNKLKVLPLAFQLIQSTYMTYCYHKSNVPMYYHADYDQNYYLCGKPVSPIRFDKRISFPKSYMYDTEAILITKFSNPADLDEWISHHIDRIGFEHIQVFDNDSDYDVQSVCSKFGEAVTYEKVHGEIRQYRIYDEYVNYRSNARWVMPIDDDEYLITDMDSIHSAIQYYENKFDHLMMLGVRWKHLFPKSFKYDRTGKVLEYCTEENPELAKLFMERGDAGIKTIVKRYGQIHYEETWENPHGGHVPKHSAYKGATMCDGTTVVSCGIDNCPETLNDEHIRLVHCRYKGMLDWMNKYHNIDSSRNFRTISDTTHNERQFKFEQLLPLLP